MPTNPATDTATRPAPGVLDTLQRWVFRARQMRWLQLAVVNLRILVGFAFLPAGLKKVLGQPFTDPDNVGSFHEFMHAFLATGFFYQFVGVMQLIAATLLLTQRFATVGAFVTAPILSAITILCWSTEAYFTGVVVTLMSFAVVGLLLWDLHAWRGILSPDRPLPEAAPARAESERELIDMGLWRGCGVAILGLYFAVCALAGGVYRPRGVELDNPAFYLLPTIALMPVITFAIEYWRRRARR